MSLRSDYGQAVWKEWREDPLLPFHAISHRFAKAAQDLDSITDREWVKAPLKFSMGVAETLIHLPIHLFHFGQHFFREYPQRVQQDIQKYPLNPLVFVGAHLFEAGKLLFYEPMLGLADHLYAIGTEIEQTGRMNWQQAGAFSLGAAFLAKGVAETGLGVVNALEGAGVSLAGLSQGGGPPLVTPNGAVLHHAEARVVEAVGNSSKPVPAAVSTSAQEEKAGSTRIDATLLIQKLESAIRKNHIRGALYLLERLGEVGGEQAIAKLRQVAEEFLDPHSLNALGEEGALAVSAMGQEALRGLARQKSRHALEMTRQIARGEKGLYEYDVSGEFCGGRVLKPTHAVTINLLLEVLREGGYGEEGALLLREVLESVDYRIVESDIRGAIPHNPGIGLTSELWTLTTGEAVFETVGRLGEGDLLFRLLEANREWVDVKMINYNSGPVFHFSPAGAAKLEAYLERARPKIEFNEEGFPYFVNPARTSADLLSHRDVLSIALRQRDWPALQDRAARTIWEYGPEKVSRVLRDKGLCDPFLESMRRQERSMAGVISAWEVALVAHHDIYMAINLPLIRAVFLDEVQRILARGRSRIGFRSAFRFLQRLAVADGEAAAPILIGLYQRFAGNREVSPILGDILESTLSERAARFFSSESLRLSLFEPRLKRELKQRAVRIVQNRNRPNRAGP